MYNMQEVQDIREFIIGKLESYHKYSLLNERLKEIMNE